MNLIDSLLDVLIEFANGIAPSMGSVIDFKIPIDNIIGPSMGLVGALQELKTRLDEPKSDIVKTN